MKARFIEPMLLLRTEKPPEGPAWLTELKIDGYRALAIKNDGQIQLGPVLVARFEFVEWMSDAHLRLSRLVALREDKKAKDVVRELRVPSGRRWSRTLRRAPANRLRQQIL